jgi:hypothetical protein
LWIAVIVWSLSAVIGRPITAFRSRATVRSAVAAARTTVRSTPLAIVFHGAGAAEESGISMHQSTSDKSIVL